MKGSRVDEVEAAVRAGVELLAELRQRLVGMGLDQQVGVAAALEAFIPS